MLKRFGKAYTINPAKRLLDKITEYDNLKENVNIIVERKDIIYKLKANVETIKKMRKINFSHFFYNLYNHLQSFLQEREDFHNLLL